MVLTDCSAALKLNQLSVKAYYRSAVALLALDRPTEALDCCARALEVDEENVGAKSVAGKALKRQEHLEEKEKEAAERIRRGVVGKKTLEMAFKVRCLRLMKSYPESDADHLLAGPSSGAAEHAKPTGQPPPRRFRRITTATVLPPILATSL